MRFVIFLTQVRNTSPELVQTFISKAAAKAKSSCQSSEDQHFPLVELDWFSRNSYNLALRVCSKWDPNQTLKLVQACLKV